MTKEQAIERLKRIDVKFFISGMNEASNYIIDEADKVNKAIETVLSMLEQKDKEIEKKDKIIDRMSITIIQRDIGKNYCEFNKSCEKCEDGSRDFKCKDCIKQYFKELVERKSEEWKKI